MANTLDGYLRIIAALEKTEEPLIEIISDKNEIATWSLEHKNEIGLIFQDRYITFVRDLVKFPNGKLGAYNRIINTALLDNSGNGAVVLPVNKDTGQVLLLRVFRHPIRAWSIEVPRGFGEPKMSPQEIAHKEVSEEIQGKVLQTFSLGVINSNTGLEANATNIYLCYVSGVGSPSIAEGIQNLFWVTPTKLREMIHVGEINDAFTICAFTRAMLMGFIDINT